MKIKLEIDLDLPLDVTCTGDARALIEQEVCDHVLGDAHRFQLMMRMKSAAKGHPDGQGLSSREFWSDVLAMGKIKMVSAE